MNLELLKTDKHKLFLIFFVTAIILLSYTPVYSQNKPSDEFTRIVKEANDFYSLKDYQRALDAYQKASTVVPGQKQVEDRILEINKILSDKAQNQSFEEAVLQGEKAFKAKDYPTAKRYFENALNIDPSAQYPKDRLAAIRQEYNDPTDVARFNEAMTKGKQELTSRHFPEARNWFEIALSSQPGSREAKDKIAETDRLNTEYISKKQQYEKLVADGDKLLQSDKRQDARILFQQAADLLPLEIAAHQKIQEIDNYLNLKKAQQESFDKSIELADQFYINRDFTNARLKYQEALKIKPEARYPKDMIDKSKVGEANALSDKEKFDKIIASADEFYKKGDMDAALLEYRSALELIPSSAYPQAKITEIENTLSERNSRKAAYDIAIRNGDQAFGEQKLDIALGHYRNAISLFPMEKYPKEKIDQIQALNDSQRQKDNEYQKAITAGDSHLKEKKYQDAILAFQQALTIKPNEEYPNNKINEINALLLSMQTSDSNYNSAISRADQAMNIGQYTDAITSYSEASSIKPDEKYPKEKIVAINAILIKQKTEQNRYNDLLAAADKAYNAKNYTLALPNYQNASSLKPAEQYPIDRIADINQFLKDNKAREDQYTQAIINADKLLSDHEYEQARTTYTEASTLKPDEKYPLQKVEEINNILENSRKLNSDYSQLVSKGDSLLKVKNYNQALAAYQSAIKLKPVEEYPKTKVSEINNLLADQKLLNDKYTLVVTQADKAHQIKDYATALAKFQEALSLKPEEKYPSDKIVEINGMLAELKNKNDAYQDATLKGDQAISNHNYSEALSAFQTAQSIKPAEKYPKEKISEIKGILAHEKEVQDMYSKTISDADHLLADKKYTESLAGYEKATTLKPDEKYPKEKIGEINTTLLDLKAKQESYDKALTEADKFLASKSYSEAIDSYTTALNYKPGESYPAKQIEDIKRILDGIKLNETNYHNAIVRGDAAFEAKQYEAATTAYSEALNIKPTEEYPKQRLTSIQTILTELKATDDAYAAALSLADELFNDKKYEACISEYKKALDIKPGEKYPANQILDANTQLADLKNKQDTYDKSVAEGDKSFAAKNYAEALTAFQQALTLKPSESYPAQKISEINTLVASIKDKEDKYNKAIGDGDFFYNAGKFREALEPYERASTIKPDETYPKQQKEKISKALAELKKLDDQYLSLITEADKLFNDKKYQASLSSFEAAHDLKKDESYPIEKITTIKTILTELQIRDDSYNKALAEGDAHLASKDLERALEAYNNALKIKPGETYPTEKVKSIQTEIKAIEEKYSRLLTEADSRLSARNYSEALNLYQQTLDIKPTESYPKQKISEINETLVREKEEQERLYKEAVAEGDRLLASSNYVDAKRAFVKANGIKPSEQYPKDKLIEINLVLDARNKALKDEYDKAITDADKLYQQKVLDQAIEAYENAATIKPDETYPGEMVRKIRQYIADHSILDVNSSTIVIAAGDEHKFSFKGIEPRLRSNNYVMIRAKALGTAIPKVYFNYGRDNAKNGGIVLRTISAKDGVDYLIRLTGQDKWYREDNNWFSLYTEGSAIEVSKIQISQGE